MGMNESPIRDLRYYWMTDNGTSHKSPMPIDVCCGGDIGTAEHYQFADGK